MILRASGEGGGGRVMSTTRICRHYSIITLVQCVKFNEQIYDDDALALFNQV
jgi:hypothetical protein